MICELTLTAEQLEDAAAYFGRPMTVSQVIAKIETKHEYDRRELRGQEPHQEWVKVAEVWSAWLDGSEEVGTGSGSTEAEAIDDLLSRLT